MPDRPHLGWPIRFTPDGTGYQMVEQDSAEDIAGCIATGVLWPLGTRDLDPDFGNLDPLGQTAVNIDAVRQAAAYADRRASGLTVVQDDGQLAQFVASVRVAFTQPSGSGGG